MNRLKQKKKKNIQIHICENHHPIWSSYQYLGVTICVVFMSTQIFMSCSNQPTCHLFSENVTQICIITLNINNSRVNLFT